ncbi:MAG: hypothetical protein HOP28_07230 [Gemmatimonadales bacterium]|nr:hypothetical protein [Gemmatimonadales bacterium]
MPRLTVLIAQVLSSPAAAADTTCARDFEQMTAIVTRDYAGAPAKITPARMPALTALTDSVRLAVTVTDANGCTVQLRRWVAFFRDPHLSLAQLSPPPPSAPAVSGPPRDNRPSLRREDDSTLVVTLPSFGASSKARIDSLFDANWTLLTGTPYLILDVRGNNGGGASSYDAVLRLIFTDSMPPAEFETYATEGNAARLEQFMANPGFPAALKADMGKLHGAMRGNPNGFVRAEPPARRGYDRVHANPRRVAVVIDARCVSACEVFLVDAQFSRKVVVVGASNSGGMVDYGNLLPIPLLGGRHRLSLPIARAWWLPAVSYDNVGIAPALRMPDPTGDPIAFARRVLAAP